MLQIQIPLTVELLLGCEALSMQMSGYPKINPASVYPALQTHKPVTELIYALPVQQAVSTTLFIVTDVI